MRIASKTKTLSFILAILVIFGMFPIISVSANGVPWPISFDIISDDFNVGIRNEIEVASDDISDPMTLFINMDNQHGQRLLLVEDSLTLSPNSTGSAYADNPGLSIDPNTSEMLIVTITLNPSQIEVGDKIHLHVDITDETDANTFRILTLIVIGDESPGNGETTVTDVNVTPQSAELAPGESRQFAAIVIGNNSPPQNVIWSLSQNAGDYAGLSDTGLLTLDDGARIGASFAVIATSTFGDDEANRISGQAAVTISAQDSGNRDNNGNGGDPGEQQPPPPPPPTENWVTSSRYRERDVPSGTGILGGGRFDDPISAIPIFAFSAISQDIGTTSLISQAQAQSLAHEALAQAQSEGRSIGQIRLIGPQEVSIAMFQAMVAAAGNNNLRINADSILSDGSVDVRISVNPRNVTANVNLHASTTSSAAVSVREFFERVFEAEVGVVSLTQQGSFGMEVVVAARLDIPVTQSNLNYIYFYSYDRQANNFRSFSPGFTWLDSNGYLHFSTSLAGDIIISRVPLA